MNLRIRHVVVCRFAQETAYIVPLHTMTFSFSGMEYSESPGFLAAEGSTGFGLTPRGLPIRFRYNERRENYAILFESDDVRLSEVPGRAEIRHEGEWFQAPVFVAVDQGRLEGWRVELERIRAAFLMPTARNRLCAELGVLNMIRHIVDEVTPAIGVSPAGRLKNLIDADSGGRVSLDELCATCGYSPDHLRILFAKEFGATPKQYRMRRRMAEAMEWIAGSRLSTKEIAGRLGFSQVSHFSAAFKAAHGLSPREGIRRFRGAASIAPRLSVVGIDPALCPDVP